MSAWAKFSSTSNSLVLGDETYVLQRTDRSASSLFRFDDPRFEPLKQYVYNPLPPKMIRLMRLNSGDRDDSIQCELFEAAYDNSFHIPTHVSRKWERSKFEPELEDVKQSLSRLVKRMKTMREQEKRALDGSWWTTGRLWQMASTVSQMADGTWNTTAMEQMREIEKTRAMEETTAKAELKAIEKPIGRFQDRFEELKRKILGEELEAVEKIEIEYEALSWCWGRAVSDYVVLVTKGDQSYKMPVRKDLALALKYLRHQGRPRILWIDAICIDQENDVERNQQVQMMSRIYTRAANVCIWLGQQDNESEVAFKFIKEEITHLKDFDAISSDKDYGGKWLALMVLMQREWFSRRWVVQELSLANKAEIWCGPDSMPWKEFAVAVELFVEVETATHRLSEVMQKDVQSRHVPGWFEHVSQLGASLLVQATGKVFRSYGTPMDENEVDDKALDVKMTDEEKAAEEEKAKKKANEEKHGQRTKSLDNIQTIDPLDRRSLLSLEAYSDVCRDFMEFCIRRKNARDPVQALDILCRPWALEPQLGSSARLKKKKRKSPADRAEKPRLIRERSAEWKTKYSDFKDYQKRLIQSSTNWSSGKARELCEESRKRKAQERKENQDDKTKMEEFRDIALPSWIPRAKNAPFEIYRHPGMQIKKTGRTNVDPVVGWPTDGRRDFKKTGRANADPLVGWPQDGHRNYSAAQTETVKLDCIKFRKRPYLGHYSLYVTGFKVDEIDEVRDASQGGNIPNSWLELSGWEPPYTQDPPAEFWRTIVADRGFDNRNPPYYFARACRESVDKGGRESGRVNTTALINNERNSIIAEFCRRVHAVIWGRSLFKTKEGRLGLGKDVRKGDLVCILHGCTVPVILSVKKKQRGDRDNEIFEDQYQTFRSCVQKLEKILVCKRRYENQKEKYKKQEGNTPAESSWEQDVKRVREEVNSVLIEDKKRRDKEREEAKEQRGKKETTKQRFQQDEETFYVFKGESYVHGCMDGEAVRERFYGNEQEWIYELR
ncbi:uncharacterized protein J4E84_001927 [Alternaria hordeiaustralica]|uniref:uncharacterized protein n=1 Tax=Alternaria hordeiaustralica TaxID=1187925 RepID=UPI0020C1C75F|nr:uncharacterized protein J4E84_001927 [Alternaria hordeiaustralica]KAI4695301.1 hypothetical protein J4E84_001927 [Alternaria hordeiaustralica]